MGWKGLLGIVLTFVVVGGGVVAPAISSQARPTGGMAMASPDAKALVAGNSSFAVDLYRKLGEKEGNVFFSPYSVSTALAMTYAGARENTQKEMAATLHFSLEQEKLHPAFSRLQARLKDIQRAGVIDLYVANSLWPQRDHPFLPEYLQLLRTSYGVSITMVDYQTGPTREAARQRINAWVKQATRGKITDIIAPKYLTDLTRLVLTNAIYFKGKWLHQFRPMNTKDAPFHISASRTVQVPMMEQTDSFGYAETESAQILQLPYRGKEVSMLVLLPKEVEGLGQIEQKLSTGDFNEWRSRLRETKVNVFLPKFETTFMAALKPVLQAMGMIEAFQWPGANFAGFDGDPRWFYIGEVLHKAYVKVDEEGTVAAAATAVVGMGGGRPAPPPVFRADHPFLFLIQENSTGSILFLGRVADPR
jgi:serine protease inhibitor